MSTPGIISRSPRVAFVADPHIGNHRRHATPGPCGVNSRARLALDALAAAARNARAWNCPLVVLGDLFDRANTDPRLIAATMEALALAPRAVVLLGNHDAVSAAEGDNALAPLRHTRSVDVVDRPRPVWLESTGVGPELWLIPWRPGAAKEWLPGAVAAVEEMARATRLRASPEPPPVLLGLHLGIEDEKTPEFLRGAEDSISASVVCDLMARHGVRAAFAGNWHDRRRWEFITPEGGERVVLQVGALSPTGWSNPGVQGYGGLAWWDGERVGCDTLGGPRFLTARTAEEFQEAVALGRARLPVFVRWVVEVEDLPAAREAIDEAMAEGHLAGGEAVVDAAEVVATARTAATAARTAPTLEEALRRYTSAMELPPGVEAEAVLSRSRRYLGLAGGAL